MAGKDARPTDLRFGKDEQKQAVANH